MKKMILSVSAAALLSVSSLAGAGTALAGSGNYWQQDQHIGSFCEKYPRATQCNDWKMNHTQWSNTQYRGFYRYHRNDNGFGGNSIAALFGFAATAALVSAIDNGDDHVRACGYHYRSYDMPSDTFMGFDGARHLCRL